jgi:transcription antitermination factor NusG
MHTTSLLDSPELHQDASVPAADQVAWHVLRTRSRQEKCVAAALEARNIHCFLPMTQQVRYYGRRKIRRAMPLFPGYVFLNGRIEDTWAAERTRRVVQTLRVTDQQRLAHELDQIRLALQAEAPLGPARYLRQGMRVVVRAGPFAGLEGVIEHVAPKNRLTLQIDALAVGASLEIDGDLLEPLD